MITSRTPAALAGLFLLLAARAALAQPGAVLTPLDMSGTRLSEGAQGYMAQVSGDWRGPIYGAESWGTGIWGLADADQVLSLTPGSPSLTASWTGVVDKIAFSDAAYQQAWGGTTWDSQSLAPVFAAGADSAYQDNWATSFRGLVSVQAEGYYNFGVLHDDGFRFTLTGGNGSASMAVDGLNPRDLTGFGQDIYLASGLYAYQLESYDRLEAGVVQLSWMTPGATEWSTISGSNLQYVSAVEEPGTLPMLLSGLGLVALLTRRRTGRRVF